MMTRSKLPDLPAHRPPWATRWLSQPARQPELDKCRSPERRQHPRWPMQCPFFLIDDDGHTIIRCFTENLSARGAKVIVPAHATVPVHGECQFRLMLQYSDRGDALEHLEGQATITRSDWLLVEDGPCRAVALQFNSEQIISFLKNWPTAAGGIF